MSGLEPRRAARDLLAALAKTGQPLAELLGPATPAFEALSVRDRGLAHMIAQTSLRRRGQIQALLDTVYTRGLPARSGRLSAILQSAACQLLFLNVPSHAAVDTAVRLAEEDPRSRRYTGLVNAGLRRLAKDGPALLAAQDAARLNTPDWLWCSWVASYGEERTRRIAQTHLEIPPLDLSVKSDPAGWAERLGGTVLATGTVRLASGAPVTGLAGFDEGEWWVQDVAAALPARLLGDVAGKTVIDLCAAPGGKTAQLAVTGAKVTAIDRSRPRLARLDANLKRLRLAATSLVADAAEWRPHGLDGDLADAVLLDAPCTSTGTLRRHPDVAWQKSPEDRDTLAGLQQRLLRHAATMVKPGGLLIYATCSLQPEECEQQIEAFLKASPSFRREPVETAEIGDLGEAITAAGDLRTLPDMAPMRDVAGSMDGFFAARLRAVADA